MQVKTVQQGLGERGPSKRFLSEGTQINRLALSIEEYSKSIIDRLQASASVKTVYGEPVTAEGKTIIPVARVGYGFGAGFGAGKNRETEAEGGASTGGGGGVGASPVGVIEITEEGTRFIPVGEETRLLGALLVGLFLGLLFARRR
jgi:uncharacterized spore protein YtfJ